MKSKGISAILSLVFLLPFISAQFFGSGFGFSPAATLANIDAQTIFILVAFIVFFGMIFLSLSTINLFREQKGATTMMAIAVSLGATWYLNTSFSLSNLFYGIGFTADLFPYLLVGFLVVFLFLMFKFKYKTLITTGILLILLPFTGLIYEDWTVIIAGILLLIIGFLWSRKSKGQSFSIWKTAVSIIVFLVSFYFTEDPIISAAITIVVAVVLFLFVKKKTTGTHTSSSRE